VSGATTPRSAAGRSDLDGVTATEPEPIYASGVVSRRIVWSPAVGRRIVWRRVELVLNPGVRAGSVLAATDVGRTRRMGSKIFHLSSKIVDKILHRYAVASLAGIGAVQCADLRASTVSSEPRSL
jgi:hypothetical protein